MTHLSQPEDDRIQRRAEKETVEVGFSPMDPPDAYHPPAKVHVDTEAMHPFLKSLMGDHEVIKEALTSFEATIVSMKQSGVTKQTNQRLAHFFHIFDEVFIPHDKREEKNLFPILEKKLIENGEHSKGLMPSTAIELMENDHIKAIQQAAVIFNFFALAGRLKNDFSRNLVLDAAVTQSEELIELLRLHIFREDTILFPLAQQHLSVSELSQMQV